MKFWFLALAIVVMLSSCRTPDVEYRGSVPIVFHPEYDITFFGLEKLHPFDSAKYGRAHRRIVEEAGIDEGAMARPTEVRHEDLLLVHTEEYLESLKKPAVVAGIAELPPLAALPRPLVEKNLLRPMRLATGGTILASELALQNGWAVNLSGGYHHAKPNGGEGFCVYADLPVAAAVLWKKRPDLRFLVIDLDAHQGNGLEACFKDDPRVHIVDLYHSGIYPNDEAVKPFIATDLPIPGGTGDAAYLALLKRHLGPAFDAAQPDLVLYNAGTDVYRGDPLGDLNLSAEGIYERDALVFREALKRKIPIAMVPSGGYTEESADLIAESLLRIFQLPQIELLDRLSR